MYTREEEEEEGKKRRRNGSSHGRRGIVLEEEEEKGIYRRGEGEAMGMWGRQRHMMKELKIRVSPSQMSHNVALDGD